MTADVAGVSARRILVTSISAAGPVRKKRGRPPTASIGPITESQMNAGSRTSFPGATAIDLKADHSATRPRAKNGDPYGIWRRSSSSEAGVVLNSVVRVSNGSAATYTGALISTETPRSGSRKVRGGEAT